MTRLPEDAADRLLARASELDMQDAQASDVVGRHLASDARAVTDLRTAALEAGISARAFDAALAELQEEAPRVVPPLGALGATRTKLSSRRRLAALAVAFVAAGLGLMLGSRGQTPATITEVFALRCMTAQTAADLLRPTLADPARTSILVQAGSPVVLTVRTTRAEMPNVRAALARLDGNAGAACPVP